jgi:hypothetical protein
VIDGVGVGLNCTEAESPAPDVDASGTGGLGISIKEAPTDISAKTHPSGGSVVAFAGFRLMPTRKTAVAKKPDRTAE